MYLCDLYGICVSAQYFMRRKRFFLFISLFFLQIVSEFFHRFLACNWFSPHSFCVATFLVLLLLIAQMYFAFFMELAMPIQQQQKFV